MGTVYVFFADGFEEIEAFTSVDVMRRVPHQWKILYYLSCRGNGRMANLLAFG